MSPFYGHRTSVVGYAEPALSLIGHTPTDPQTLPGGKQPHGGHGHGGRYAHGCYRPSGGCPRPSRVTSPQRPGQYKRLPKIVVPEETVMHLKTNPKLVTLPCMHTTGAIALPPLPVYPILRKSYWGHW